MADRPNILFLLTDDQRFDTIAALGNNAIHTPNLDRLVKRGCAMTNAYIPGGSSGAVCMPSRAMVHTGRTLYHLDRQGQTIPDDHMLMGEHFQRHGYDVFGTGKWHNSADAYARSFSAGADIFFGGMSDHWNVPVCDYQPDGTYPEPRRAVIRWGQHLQRGKQRMDRFATGSHSTDLFVDSTRHWLDTRETGNPFFAYVAFMAPHDPREMPAEYLNLYRPDEIKLPPNFQPEHHFDTGMIRIRDEMLAGFPRTEKEVRKHIAEYYAMISHVDARIGDLIDTLESTGQLDNTIIVLGGDNGLAVGQHGLFGKQSCYEHSVHIPMLISGPGVPANQQRDAMCYLADAFPTLCELADIDIPDTVETQSLLPILEGDNAQSRDSLIFAMVDNQRAIRQGNWKLIETAVDGTRCTQLFDLQTDPWEMTNLAGRAQHRATVQSLRESLRTQWESLDDDQPGQGGDFWQRYDQATPTTPKGST